MNKRATIVVDLQNEYLPDGKLPLVGLDAALANAARVIAAARAHGELLIHVRHESAQPDAPVFTPGTIGVQIIPAVAAEAGEPVIVKNHPNSFRGTQLKELLDAQGVKELVVIGAMSHMCIEATSRAAADFGYPVTVAHDACATMNLEFDGTAVPAAQVHAASMAALSFGYASITSTDKHLA
ncbi:MULTISPECIES: cysteine hydrolase family protein [unclassified Variovorax]|uniref:cysteine hydrolase family protein n=1 Tax=unclassified Variovorax TaxID=663243 RepID=UPI0008399A21|nr:MULTISPECIES: cysteine hydrolase family protein [unclassified Variovorax]PNG47100.1 Streptothricin hydrolase [Variovorax sp. B2]PNG48249.1 Streptothricin hydrolase [Variovorax sp. B4]VTV14963.1 Streptothricin hydrolase [Variovorax sp. WDL1]